MRTSTLTMPAETAPQDRIWMAFPREGVTLGDNLNKRDAGYAAWSEAAIQVSQFAPVTMICDPSETKRAQKMLGNGIEIVEQDITEYWMRDVGPTFVHDHDGAVVAIDWIFNGWGAQEWSTGKRDDGIAAFIAQLCDVPIVSSALVNEGGGFHVDGEGTVLLTETVQLDPRRNPYADRKRVEAELSRTLGTTKAIWLPQGLTRDYEPLGTRGHVDIVATFPAPGKVLLHDQPNPSHPDHSVCAKLKRQLEAETDAKGRTLEIIDLPAPSTLRDEHGFVEYSYINHLVCNDGVIACGFDEDHADAQAGAILADAYPGREVVMMDARDLFARGGGIHCITQQQPAAKA